MTTGFISDSRAFKGKQKNEFQALHPSIILNDKHNVSKVFDTEEFKEQHYINLSFKDKH